ncbi:UDP-2,3-diacylglucosamine diphosphatase [Pseudoteredinibacter isoporae]|uniref:UDP-2,3-diacylglucosamine hydrolase n=1 Tax=Pseudoteredinibacter isoporae TaxID=570281 RepID=A0A7X0MXC5_9GAMM|nr:UDP-2,3-diacylglucosamine diphosphatase [Pseudoteredinibacter isoporae]MBB6523110.1 UDP-2,3-diacylglucosamine hydrolase [Pseudoteredinibacter isoporae]NHO88630.1 UDP-2,3-diacylglucosamine diphosphatase [Pseudoteredinibacter isoporae]NIB22679.1 UDP-2,3-diacylglucosamine diphosphatase [Pseudoteredinibacter isoporae]
MSVLFISDLHLDESRPEVTEAFFQFLQERAPKAEALYILGDFFEVWIGDDDDAPLALEVQQRLKQLSQNGTTLYIMHGNRDFLYGDQFCENSGATLLADPTLINVAGKPCLLMHGDSLCTDDAEYMAFRQQARNPAWQAQLLSQPLEARRQLAMQLRQQSKSMSAMKADDIMDVNAEAVANIMESQQAEILIHGHTHRPAQHALGNDKERWVLGDWHDKGWCIEADEHSIRLESWSIA